LAFLCADYLEVGFYTGHGADEAKRQYIENCFHSARELTGLLAAYGFDSTIHFGSRSHRRTESGGIETDDCVRWEGYLSGLVTEQSDLDISAVSIVPRREAISLSSGELISRVAATFKKVYPLFLMATTEEPVDGIRRYLKEFPLLPADPLPVVLPPGRTETTYHRINRDTQVAEAVKAIHRHRCQVCGIRLVTQDGCYAEGAHIRPLGGPHNGPDCMENILCLCPNHHVLFNRGAFGISEDLTFRGLEGRLRTHVSHWIDPRHLAYHRERLFRRPQ
jgi:hypothetical protein